MLLMNSVCGRLPQRALTLSEFVRAVNMPLSSQGARDNGIMWRLSFLACDPEAGGCATGAPLHAQFKRYATSFFRDV
jgi:hypothetical protein